MSKIKDLEAQCWKDTSPEWAENCIFTFDTAKFANLIIDECISNIYRVGKDNADTAIGLSIVRVSTLKEF